MAGLDRAGAWRSGSDCNEAVDFRKGATGLATLVQAEIKADPFSGTVFVFHARRADRIKLVFWDGTGLCLFAKTLEDGRFRWPKIEDGAMRLNPAQLDALSGKSPTAKAIRYALSHWAGLSRFIDDGRVELDTNTVERAIRPQALTRKNALFAGSDGGAQHWACLASLIETAKLNGVDPLAYLGDILARLAQGHPINRIAELLPWAYNPASIEGKARTDER